MGMEKLYVILDTWLSISLMHVCVCVCVCVSMCVLCACKKGTHKYTHTDKTERTDTKRVVKPT